MHPLPVPVPIGLPPAAAAEILMRTPPARPSGKRGDSDATDNQRRSDKNSTSGS